MNEVELVIYDTHGTRHVIGKAQVGDDGKTVAADITDPVWAEMIFGPVGPVSVGFNKREGDNARTD